MSQQFPKGYIAFALLALCFVLTLPSAYAGSNCSDKPQTAEVVQKSFQLALKTREALDASGAQVALLARVGQDLSHYHLRYSHIAFAWRDHPQGKWLVVHELNQCGTAHSNLFDEGLANFFYDDLFAWDALIITPSPALQARIVAQLQQTSLLTQMHETHYNMLAYPFSTQYQNSNQWVLEVLTSALGDARDRPAAQDWLKQAGYQPSALHVPPLRRLGARMFKANIAFDDHPSQDRAAGKIEVATVESIRDFLLKIDPESQTQTLRLEK